MPVIQDPVVRSITQDMFARAAAGSSAAAYSEHFNELIAAFADRPDLSSQQAADKLRAPTLSWAERWQIARDGLDATEERDLRTLTGAAEYRSLFGRETKAGHFLTSLLAARAPDNIAQVMSSVATPDAIAAVAEFKQYVQQPAQLNALYEAAIGVGDAALGEKARALFARLPKITDAISAEDMVALGLWTQAPRGIKAMQNSARYLPGRQVISPAKVSTDLPDNWGDQRARDKFLAWSDDGLETVTTYGSTDEVVTYRATLVGERGDHFLVKIDGKDTPIEVAKEKIFKRNQPHKLSGDKININGKMADYDEIYLKAKLCEAALKMSADVARLDFRKTQASNSGVLGRIFGGGGGLNEEVSALQRRIVGNIHDVIDMEYKNNGDPGRIGGREAGRQAVRGVGVCNEQAGVMAALLVPFQHLLGFDIQMITGGVYRNTNRTASQEEQFRSFNTGAHSWIQVTYRPSMEMRIIDRTWQQADHPADKAYSYGGDRYPTGPSSSYAQAEIKPTDVRMDGSVTVKTIERQFGELGVDDRSNHMSLRNRTAGTTTGTPA